MRGPSGAGSKAQRYVPALVKARSAHNCTIANHCTFDITVDLGYDVRIALKKIDLGGKSGGKLTPDQNFLITCYISFLKHLRSEVLEIRKIILWKSI